jgi:hypothetical protein
LSNEYLDLVINFPIPEDYKNNSEIDYCYHKITEDIGIVYAKRSELPKARFTQATYSFYPKCYGLMATNTTYLSEAGILSVQEEPLNLTGKGVTIGFIDTGIRYNEAVFKDYVGKSRIASIWDQTIQTGTPPEGFEYGSEYTKEMINEAIASQNPFSIVPSTDVNGHGSVLASLAAGSFGGAAPDCNIAVVKLKEVKDNIRDYYKIPLGVPCYSETDILQGIQYLQKYSEALKSPLVICIGLGTSWGDHTGSGILDSYINIVGAKKSNVVVTAGGNEGNGARHFHGEFNDNTYRDVQLRVGENDKGFVMDLWGDAPYYYNAVIRSPGGETISWNSPKNAIPQEYTFIYEKTRIIIDYLLVEQTSGSELIRFKFIEPTKGVWNIRISSESNTGGMTQGGAFDVWLPIGQFISTDTYFLEPNPDITITEPAYAGNAITVANYNFLNNSIATDSGRGYARDKYIVPDIAAPGVNISTSFGTYSGSSLSAAVTAGGCAQFMQWAVVEQHDILVNSLNVKNYLIRGASRERNLEYPNRQWGYGRLNVEGIFEFLAGL